MKNARLIIGIVTIVLSVIVMFQSCAAGLGEAMMAVEGDTSGTSGAAGIMLALAFIIGGIVAIVGRRSKVPSIVAGVFYALGGLIGIVNVGIFGDLMIWSVLSFAFALVFIITGIIQKDKLL